MELTAEDDDLLSYFLSADVASEQIPPPKPSEVSGVLYPASADGSGPSAAGGNQSFAFGQGAAAAGGGQDRSFASTPSNATPAASGSSGTVSTLQQMQSAFHAAENAMMRSSFDDDAPSGSTFDSDEKRQRR